LERAGFEELDFDELELLEDLEMLPVGLVISFCGLWVCWILLTISALAEI